MPNLNVPAHNQKSQRDRENDLHNLRCDQDLAFIPFISERPSRGSERKCGQAGGKINQTKQDRFVCKPAHDPALRHHLHPCAAVGNDRTDDVTAKRALPQKRERFASNPFFLLFHREHSSLERRLCQTLGAALALAYARAASSLSGRCGIRRSTRRCVNGTLVIGVRRNKSRCRYVPRQV